MALIEVDTDPWLTELSACEKLYHETNELLSTRSRDPDKTSQNYARLSANIRLRLKQFSTEVQQLKEKLHRASIRKTITSEETERRGRQVEVLESKEIQLQHRFEDRATISGATGPSSRSRLFMGSQQRPGYSGLVPDSDDEPLDTRDESVGDLRTHMRRLEEEQDHGLEALSKVISRQKQIAETIGGEVDLQNEIIDDLADQMERTDSNITRETGHVSIIGRKDATCGYWVMIILLMIAIILVWTV